MLNTPESMLITPPAAIRVVTGATHAALNQLSADLRSMHCSDRPVCQFIIAKTLAGHADLLAMPRGLRALPEVVARLERLGRGGKVKVSEELQVSRPTLDRRLKPLQNARGWLASVGQTADGTNALSPEWLEKIESSQRLWPQVGPTLARLAQSENSDLRAFVANLTKFRFSAAYQPMTGRPAKPMVSIEALIAFAAATSIRDQRDMTVNELAQKLKVSERTIERLIKRENRGNWHALLTKAKKHRRGMTKESVEAQLSEAMTKSKRSHAALKADPQNAELRERHNCAVKKFEDLRELCKVADSDFWRSKSISDYSEQSFEHWFLAKSKT